jgi:hypothetical protein
VALAIALYSAFILDLDTMGCLRALQETRLVPRKIANLPVDLLSSRDPAKISFVG